VYRMVRYTLSSTKPAQRVSGLKARVRKGQARNPEREDIEPALCRIGIEGEENSSGRSHSFSTTYCHP